MSPEAFIFGYMLLLIGGIVVVAVSTELRTRRFEPEPTEDRVFRCRTCGFVYTDDSDVDLSRCQHCGTMNEAIQF